MTSDTSLRCPPLRVLHLITDLDVGGAETMLVRLVGAADRTRVEHTVVSLMGGGVLADELTARGIGVEALTAGADRPGPGALLRLIHIIRRIRPHVLQTWLYHADVLGLFAAALLREPALVWNIRCSELTAASASRAFPLLLRALALGSGRPAAVICNSHAGRRVHEELGYRPRRWEVIPNGLDTTAFRPCGQVGQGLRREIGVEGGSPLVGLVARLHPMKGHPTFLHAAALVARERPDVRFVAVGRGVGMSAMLAGLVAGLNIGGCVHLLDERRDIARVLAALDVAVSASDSEGFPNAVIEAMACGVPCVVTDAGDSAAIVAETGVVVPPRQPEALAAGILRMLALPADERLALGRAARERVEREYALEHVAQRYQSLYEALAGGTASAPGPVCAA